MGRLSEFSLDPKKTYRIRIINASALADFDSSIDYHGPLIIEADSTEGESFLAHYVSIASGQHDTRLF